MGTLALAAKVTHVPSMLISERPGPHHGCRDAAIAGHHEISQMAEALGVDTLIVFDTHWLVNAGYHINANSHHQGIYTSHEFPHFIQNLEYEYEGNSELAHAIAEIGQSKGLNSMSHEVESLTLEYGTLVPMRYMNSERKFKVVSIAAWCSVHNLEDSMLLGEAVKEAIDNYDGKVAVIASGSLSHQIWNNRQVADGMFTISSEFNRQADLAFLKLLEEGDIKTALDMMPEYAKYCSGEGGMHDTAMLLGVLGGRNYQGKAQVLTPYFPSSGTGQCNLLFSL
ncbi:3,4-dihydroxyphenylacetate 2,3-dioxygenase [Photobacterium minamisatsumaniensis]|uniref:3,4-dihydroxyphenylacetate 2,3-dioxygenase n=1 Tax=Photobacterium minamisatsumaniensis TaxID=2910233 RepID=UPI003D0FD02C